MPDQLVTHTLTVHLHLDFARKSAAEVHQELEHLATLLALLTLTASGKPPMTVTPGPG